MSPEQARNAKLVDHRTDVWSLAISLHEVLSGERPWRGRTSMGEIILAICTEEVAPLATLAPWIDPALAAVVHRGLAKDPGARWQTVADFAAALEPFAARRPLASGDLTHVDPAHRPRRDLEIATSTSQGVSKGESYVPGHTVHLPVRRWPMAVTIGVAVAAVGGIGFSTVSRWRSDPVAQPAQPSTSVAASPEPPPTASSAAPPPPPPTAAVPDAGVPPIVGVARAVAGAKRVPSAVVSAAPSAAPSSAPTVGRGGIATDLPFEKKDAR
jgi:serine/threonine protein kinase